MKIHINNIQPEAELISETSICHYTIFSVILCISKKVAENILICWIIFPSSCLLLLPPSAELRVGWKLHSLLAGRGNWSFTTDYYSLSSEGAQMDNILEDNIPGKKKS